MIAAFDFAQGDELSQVDIVIDDLMEPRTVLPSDEKARILTK